MPSTHYRGDRFWHRIRLQREAPLHHTYPTVEYQHPFRVSPTSHIWRLPGTGHGIVVGRWTSQVDEDKAAIIAAEARQLTTEETEDAFFFTPRHRSS